MAKTNKQVQLTGTRFCRRCKQIKDVTEFVWDKRGKCYTNPCIPCSAARAREYYAKHKEKVLARTRRWYAANKEKVAKTTNLWRKRNLELVLTRAHLRRVKIRESGCFTVKEWHNLLDKFNHKCLSCGATGIRLSMDHVVPVSKGGTNTIDNIQPLCLSCNVRKATKIIDYRGLTCQVA